ncbi:MAG TPA: BsuPI-related putative proteinase inhibitor [Longimicrobiales bacterium]
MKRWVWVLAILAAQLGACTASGDFTGPDSLRANRTVSGITYRADTRVMESFPVRLGPTVSVRNDSGTPRTIRFPDGCVVLLRVYTEPERTGQPAWDQARTVGCFQAIQEVDLAPGDTATLAGGTIGAAEILGDSLPAGRYYFTVVLRPDGQVLELAAGAADLAQ